MTKRALIIIAVLMILPVLAALVFYSRWKAGNRVVATYGDSVDQVIYGKKTLNRIDGAGDYLFRFGDYLGKVDDRLFGTQLYTLRDDESGKYYVIAGKDGGILLSETGLMADGLPSEDSSVTRLILGRYLAFTDEGSEIAVLLGGEKDPAVSPYARSEYGDGKASEYPVSVCYDGSAVATGKAGFFVHLTEKNRWLYVSETESERAETAFEEGEDDVLTYRAVRVELPAKQRLLDRLTGRAAAATDTAEVSGG
jgi:hypothetical protein